MTLICGTQLVMTKEYGDGEAESARVDLSRLMSMRPQEEQIADGGAKLTKGVVGEFQQEDCEALLVQTMVPVLKRHVCDLRLMRERQVRRGSGK